jgi:hypothetical protein
MTAVMSNAERLAMLQELVGGFQLWGPVSMEPRPNRAKDDPKRITGYAVSVLTSSGREEQYVSAELLPSGPPAKGEVVRMTLATHHKFGLQVIALERELGS